jgi:oligoribonuclease
MSDHSNARKDLYIWFDTEYSGLELEDAYLLQVSALITDTSLRRVLSPDNDVKLTIRLPADKEPSSWVEENLSDLLAQCRSAKAVDVADADQYLAAYVDKAAGPVHPKKDQRPVLAGNTIHSDWRLAQRFLPRFLSRLHYRHLDVTAFKLEWKRLHLDTEFDKENPLLIKQYFPEAILPAAGKHDAYYDLQASIAELAFYRFYLFKTP